MTRSRIRWEWIAPTLFLFVLPIAHTTPFRLVCFGLSIVGVLLSFWQPLRRWLSVPVPGRWPPRSLLIAIGSWIVVCLVATVRSVDPAYSWGEFRNEVLSTTAVFAIFYWMTDSIAVWRRWRAALLASFCVVAVVAMTTYLRSGDWFRSSLVGDRNAYSTYVVLIVPFLLLLWIQAAGVPWKRAVLTIALLAAAVSGAFTQNRNLWFGIAMECIAFSLLVWFRSAAAERRRLRARYLAALIVGVLVFGAVLTYVVRQKAIVSKTTAEEQIRFDRDPRFEIWQYAAERIRERPLMGHGYGRGILRGDFRTHFDNPLKWHGHNIVVDYGLEAGVIGMLAIIGLFGTLAWAAWRIYRSADGDLWLYGGWSLVMLLGIAIKIMTDDILVRETSLLFWALLGMSFGLASRGARVEAPATQPT